MLGGGMENSSVVYTFSIMYRHCTRLWKYWLSKIYSCLRIFNFDRGLIDQVISGRYGVLSGLSYGSSVVWLVY